MSRKCLQLRNKGLSWKVSLIVLQKLLRLNSFPPWFLKGKKSLVWLGLDIWDGVVFYCISFFVVECQLTTWVKLNSESGCEVSRKLIRYPTYSKYTLLCVSDYHGLQIALSSIIQLVQSNPLRASRNWAPIAFIISFAAMDGKSAFMELIFVEEIISVESEYLRSSWNILKWVRTLHICATLLCRYSRSIRNGISVEKNRVSVFKNRKFILKVE